MRSRWLSTFSILGILLIILGIVGKVIGPRFVYDPGQVADGNEAWYYLAVGALMLLNGLILPALTAEEKNAKASAATISLPAQSDERSTTAAVPDKREDRS